MPGIVPKVREKVKGDISILELLPWIRAAMLARGWTEDVRLSEASGVSRASVSRFLKHGKVSGENLLRILHALGMIMMGAPVPTCDVDCSPGLREICRKVKKIMESHTGFSNALEANIYAFAESVDLQRKLENFLKTNDPGVDGGTRRRPARYAASKRKAG